MIILNVGTIETILVRATDQTKSVTTLAGTNPLYDVKDAAGTYKYHNQAATTLGMEVECLINTTGWTPGYYKLWVKFDTSPEIPLIGPFQFYVQSV